MILHRSPDGMSYGHYTGFGFLPVVMAIMQAIPAVTNLEFPVGKVQRPPPPPSNLPLILGVGAAGVVGLGLIAMVLRSPKAKVSA